MQVDTYNLLGVLQTLAYTAGECKALANAVDSDLARRSLLNVAGALTNVADDLRVMFDNFEETVTCEMHGQVES